MTLHEHYPKIDDRKFEDIMREVYARIPRYTPEWSPAPWDDGNHSDPGIVFSQLFAWLAEMLTFRMSLVPGLNYLKFLELIGIQLNAAKPAQAEISFPVVESFAESYVIVLPRTQVSGLNDETGNTVTFETTESLNAFRARLTAVMVGDGMNDHDSTAFNDDSAQSFHPFGRLANVGSVLMLGFEDPQSVDDDDFPASIRLDLNVWTNERVPPERATCNLPPTPEYSSARIAWEYWSGTNWRSMTLLDDQTRALTQQGKISLRTPAAREMERTDIFGPDPADGGPRPRRYWIRARLEDSQYEDVPQILSIRANTVVAEQAESVRDEVLGGSDGSRDQQFQLGNTPVIENSLVLVVTEGGNEETAREVSDFFGSGNMDLDVTLNRMTGVVTFGSGIEGRIPIADINNPTANIIAREYKFGGGSDGNVLAGALTTLPNAIEGIDDSGVNNHFNAHDGSDDETLEQAMSRAPRTARAQCRAVANQDFELLAMQSGNIRRSKSLPLFHPTFPGVQVPGVVTVIIVPESKVATPVPSPGTIRTVCEYMNQRRLLTTELFVIPPDYQHVHIEVEVQTSPSSNTADVKEEIEATLKKYFSVFEGGEDGTGWPFGLKLHYSQINQRIFSVSGVTSIDQMIISVDGEEFEECRDVEIRENSLLYSTEHTVRVA
jgi:predicted phage baseplate assembly protein